MGGGQPTVEVTSDGHGLVSHVGSALLAQAAASKTWWWCSPTAAIACLTWPHSRPGRPVRSAASDSTAFRVIHRIASDPQALGGVMKEGSLLGREVGATGTRRGAVPRRGRHHNCNARGAAPTVRRTGPMHSH